MAGIGGSPLLVIHIATPLTAGEEIQLLSQLSQDLPGYVGHLQQQHQRLMTLVPQLQGGSSSLKRC
ncbi:MAG: hypothetical protein HC818_03440 [Synechococcaceae cyanobacterium RM1_1_27]|nr:hypothetical protein [Synechococcaceae cyanobacterium RM1_1_27]